MFKIAVCDDEDFFLSEMNQILKNYMDKLSIDYEIEIFSSGTAFLDLESEVKSFHIVFLDILMKVNGMEVARQIRNISKDIFIVFITATDAYAFEGYKVEAFRYILKSNSQYKKMLYECMDAVFSKIEFFTAKKKFHFIEGEKDVCIDRLLYVESRLHKLFFYVMEDSLNKYTLYDTLNELEKELAGMDFVRVHQSFLINMKYITSLSKYQVLLNDEITINIPRARYKYVQKVYTLYKEKAVLSYLL